MGEEIRLCNNIMSVELAMKRELEYRKKLELMNNQRPNDLKPIVFPQVPVSESTVDRKRKEPPCQGQSSRPSRSSRTVRSSARFVCVVCNIAFATAFHLRIHGETSAHRALLSKSRNGGQNISNPFLCEVCDIMVSSGRVMEFHVAGLKHATCLQEFEDAKKERVFGNFVSN